MWSYHRRFADRADRYRPAIRESVAAASAPIAAADYVLAQEARDQLTARWGRWFREHGVDALLEPTVPITAPLRGHGYDSGAGSDPATAALVALTFEWDLSGLPVVALPAGVASRTGLPVGVSLVGHRGREAPLVRLAVTIQERELAPPAPRSVRPRAGAG
jgi:aspartyl-tRNA(Asn)/glutamyl-tRNA(Gln) amidotransferase subunit A